MDLNDLENEQQDPIDVPMLFDDNGDPTDGFKVLGSNSQKYQDADRKWKLWNVKKSARRGRGVDAATENGASELVDMIAKREFSIASACIVEIYGFTIGGAAAALNDATLTAIFTKRPTWRSKVVAAIESEQLFIKASSTG